MVMNSVLTWVSCVCLSCLGFIMPNEQATTPTDRPWSGLNIFYLILLYRNMHGLVDYDRLCQLHYVRGKGVRFICLCESKASMDNSSTHTCI